jgi:diguanylate cyclase (GGDEF)-like protein
MNDKVKQLDILKAVTNSLNVGVLQLNQNNEWQILNDKMETFARECGGKALFVAEVIRSQKQLSLEDRRSMQRVFELNYLSLLTENDTILVKDITPLENQTKAFKDKSFIDNLTGLPNRMLFCKRLKETLPIMSEKQQSLIVLIIDINGFKEINNTLGHSVGDKMLCKLAKRLPNHLRSFDTFARLGGDEFGLILPHANLVQAKYIAERLLEAISEPFKIEEQLLRVSASLGIASYPEHGKDQETLIKHADVAMYMAKRQQDAYIVYDPAKDNHSVERLTLMNDLRQTIEQQLPDLSLHYQPQLDLESGKVKSLEALVRWDHPKYGRLNPDDFIPAAEETDLMGPLTQAVLNMALKQCAAWQNQGIKLTIAVNLSANNLQDAELPNWINQRLNELKVSPKLLRLEITETVIIADPKLAKKVLFALKDLGIQIAIDDFGTGYSSLSYLRQLPVREIKIDKSFVMTMEKNENDAVIVHAIIELAHNLGLKVVAEGVEDQTTQDMLANWGCDIIQGYHLSKPQPPEQLTNWLENR